MGFVCHVLFVLCLVRSCGPAFPKSWEPGSLELSWFWDLKQIASGIEVEELYRSLGGILGGMWLRLSSVHIAANIPQLSAPTLIVLRGTSDIEPPSCASVPHVA